MCRHCLRRGSLFGTKLSLELHGQRQTAKSLVANQGPDVRVRQQFQQIVKTAPGKRDVVGQFLGTCDDPRFVVGRQAHRLCLVEFWILECSESEQLVSESRDQRLFGDVDLVTKNQLQGARQRGDRRVSPRT